jgi:hypothetical protein
MADEYRAVVLKVVGTAPRGAVRGTQWAVTKSYGENPNILLAFEFFAAGWCGHLVGTVEITNGIHCRLDTLLCS